MQINIAILSPQLWPLLFWPVHVISHLSSFCNQGALNNQVVLDF